MNNPYKNPEVIAILKRAAALKGDMAKESIGLLGELMMKISEVADDFVEASINMPQSELSILHVCRAEGLSTPEQARSSEVVRGIAILASVLKLLGEINVKVQKAEPETVDFKAEEA